MENPPESTHHQPLVQLARSPAAWAVTLLTLGLCLALALDVSPLLRGPAPYPPEWRWDHVWPPDVRPVWLILPLAVAALVGGWALLARRQGRATLWALLALAGLALAFRLAVQATSGGGLSLVARTLNPAYFGYFLPATEIADMGEYLRTFAARQAEHSIRVQTHPPGNVVFYWLFIQFCEALPGVTGWAAPLLEPHIALRPAWAQGYTTAQVLAGAAASLAVPAISALGVVPLYRLAARLGGDRAARLAAALYAFVPALVLFTPVADDLLTFITAMALWLAVEGLERGRRGWLALAGLAWGVGAFMSFGLLPVILVAGLAVVFHHAAGGRLRWRPMLLDGLALAAGAAALWIIVWAAFGLNPLAVYRAATRSHAALTGTRSYWLWLLYNPYDGLLFAGVPVAFHFARGAWRAVRACVARAAPPLAAADRLLLAFLAAMLALLVSGSVRGETARILLFVTPVMVWAAARDASREADRAGPGYAPLLTGLAALQAVVFHAVLSVYH